MEEQLDRHFGQGQGEKQPDHDAYLDDKDIRILDVVDEGEKLVRKGYILKCGQCKERRDRVGFSMSTQTELSGVNRKRLTRISAKK